MNELEVIVIFVNGILQGFILAFIMYAPDTPFKRGFIDGLTLKFIWGRFIK